MNLIDRYVDYMKDTESPYIYHRWCILSGIAALLGRAVYVQHGHKRLFANNFYLLVGPPASRKSTSILLTRELLAEAGYKKFAASKTSREKFFLDLAGVELVEEDSKYARKNFANQDNVTELNLWGDLQDTTPKESFILADEFTTFTAVGNMAFFDDLGIMWDWDSEHTPYQDRVKNSRSVSIFQPTINILAGTTAENFNRAFPPETLGTGFLSRLIIIAGKRSGRKFAFPTPPTEQEKAALVSSLRDIFNLNKENQASKEISISDKAIAILTEIYEAESQLKDSRFEYFTQRRFTHLLKLCLTLAIAFNKFEIDEEVAICANTYLAAAEFKMPEALGEFGKSKHSDVVNKIMTLIDEATEPVGIQTLWIHVRKDLEKITQLAPLIENLQQAGRIQSIRGKGWLAKKEIIKKPLHVDWSLLTEEEREGLADE